MSTSDHQHAETLAPLQYADAPMVPARTTYDPPDRFAGDSGRVQQHGEMEESYSLVLPADPAMAVTVYDGHDKLVWQGVGAKDSWLVLRRGLYTIRVGSCSNVVEKAVRMVESVDLSDLRVPRRSAAPLVGSVLHEHYGIAAREWSLKPTRAPLTTPPAARSGLLIFVRSGDANGANGGRAKPVGAGLTLRDARGATISRFSRREVARGASWGWMALSAPAAPGIYRLVSGGAQGLEVPIHVFPGFQTQAFIPDTGTPRLEEMRLFMARPDTGFQADSAAGLASDSAMESILNNAMMQPLHDAADLAAYTQSNPLFGLMRAYASVHQMQEPSYDSAGREGDVAALDALLETLAELITDSPDLAALVLLRNEILGVQADSAALTAPPMFRMGLNAVLRATSWEPDLVPEDSLLDRVTTRLMTTPLWSMWSAVPAESASPAQAEKMSGLGTLLPNFLRAAMPVLARLFRERDALAQAEPSVELSWLQAAVFSALQRRRAQGKDKAPASPTVSVADIARETHTTPRAVRREIQRLLDLDPRQRQELLSAHSDLLKMIESPTIHSTLHDMLHHLTPRPAPIALAVAPADTVAAHHIG